MIKKTLSIILTAMVIAVSGCNNSQSAENTTTEAVAPPSEAWEYEMYIEDLDYFSERYFQGIYATQSAFSMMNETDAKKHIESALEALTDLEGITYPPNLEEVHGEFLKAVELLKELTECRMVLAGYLSEYPDLTPEESAEYNKIASRMKEISNEIDEGGYTFYSNWIAAQNAAFAYLPNGSYKAYAMELENLRDMYTAEFNKLYDVYFADGDGDVAVFSNNCITLLTNIENMNVPEELKASHDEVINAISAERDAHQAVLTINQLYDEHPGAAFEDLPPDSQKQIMECDEILNNFFSEDNTEYYALDEALNAALESADTLAG